MVSDPPDRGFPARGREDRLAIPIEMLFSAHGRRPLSRYPPGSQSLAQKKSRCRVVDKLSQLGRLGEAKTWRYALEPFWMTRRELRDVEKGTWGAERREATHDLMYLSLYLV
jgi:hypothetical protein